MVTDSLDAPAHLDEPGGEPAHCMKAVDDMGGMAEVGSDRRPVGLGAVGYDDLNSLEPAMSLLYQKPLQGLGARCSTTPSDSPISAFSSTVT